MFFFLSFPVLAQAPANDDCEGAIALTVNNDLLCGVVTSATNAEATESTVNADSCLGTPNDDVWFSFVAQGPNHQVTISNIVAVSGSSTDMYIQVLSGTCGDMTSLFCSDPNSRIISGLTAGETYYVRVYSYGTSSRQTFDICLNTIPEGPANDDCTNAVVLTPSPGEDCVSTTAGTTVGATQSMEADPCSGNPNDDVWFSFTATSVVHTITLSDVESVIGSSVDMYFQVLSSTCGDMSSIICSDPNTNIATGLAAGETYYVRVYSYSSTSMQDFNICVTTPPAPPVNDECNGAIALTVNPDFSCGNVTAATTVNATQSEGSGPCYGSPDDDVWFTFVAEQTTHRISITDVEAIEGSDTDMYFQIFSGNCESKESLLCSDPESDEIEDLTVGETYYVRVYSYYSSSRQNFNICVGTFPPPPANDDCEGAIALAINNDLSCDNVTAGTTVSATESMESGECNGTPNDDVWFSFTATKTSHLVSITDVTIVNGWSSDMYFQVLSGTCGDMESIKCSDPNSVIVSNLTVGETYYIRVYSYSSTSRQNFNICVGTLPEAPANDECENAVVLTVSANEDCTDTTEGTTLGATQSMEAEPCEGESNDDVWYSFVATSEFHTVTLSDVEAVLGTSSNMYMQILGGTCNNLESVLCSNIDVTSFGNLTVGETYYVRVYSYSDTSSQNFNICVTTPPAPPANDECTGAVALIVNPDEECTNVTAGSTQNALQSPAPDSCSGTPNDDVWYSFVATGSAHIVTLSDVEAIEGSSTDMYFEVLGGECDNLESILCSDPNSNDVIGLTTGETYYVRVYSYGSTSRQNFNICIGTPPPPPANDECDGATALTVNPDFSCGNVTAGTTVSATESMEAGECNGTPNDDVWFYFVAENTQHRVSITDVDAVEGWSTDMYFQVLSGACGTMESIVCSDFNSNDVTGLTVGETYYVRVYSYSDTSRQNFNICIGTTPPPPANDECENATALTVNTDLSCDNVTAGTTLSATESMEAGECSGTPNDDVWYSFVAQDTRHQITISDVDAVDGSSTDMYFQVLSGTCGTMENLVCSDLNSAEVEDLTVGETYYVRVYSYSDTSRQNFNICIGTLPPPPANDMCADAIELTVGLDFETAAVATTNEGGSHDDSDPLPSCDATGFAAQGADIWFTVTVPPTGEISLETRSNDNSEITDTGLSAYTGTCGDLSLIECDSDDGDGNFSLLELSGLEPGTILYVRTWGYNGTTGQFDIAAYAEPCDVAAPAGDAAQELTLGDTLEDLDVDGDNLTWYSDAELTTEIDATTVAVDGTTYYVTQTEVACVSEALAITVTVTDPCEGVTAPTAEATQELTLGDTLEAIVVTGMDGADYTWYSDVELTTEIDATTVAVDGTTYYVVQTFEDCVSDALAITVTVTDPCEGVTAPTAEATQELTLGDTLEAIVVTGMAGADYTWYSDAELTTEIDVTTEAVDGTTYYVVQTFEDCVSDALAITVTVTDPCEGVTAPTAEATQELTLGDTLEAIVVTGMAGADYTWYSDAELTTEIDATTAAVDGTTYYVVQTFEDCVSDALAITVTVIDPCEGITAPTGDAVQDFTEGQTLADLEVTGDNLTWYSDAELTTEIDATTVLTDEATYYVTQTIGECTSEALAVTVNQVANTDVFGKNNFTYYPNPVTDVFTLSAQEEIKKVTIFNMLGQEVYTNGFQSNTVELDLSQLSAGSYFVNVSTANASKVVKILKN
ncbi:hypothetical protein GCM10007424_15060 [Flavobacterium suaedae]|uniref:T9SS type A sorting domain-containing protein n=1 Tax=Flavobacterium suaedae TaxID=1767027 RepID=A0ABQ1JW14_9FLAO|nr:hypothetical protein GCM10007424_15060 [Flavobacterium suaedae]